MTKQEEQAEEGTCLLDLGITSKIPELTFVLAYLKLEDEAGNWSLRSKMINNLDVIAVLNAEAAGYRPRAHSIYVVTPVPSDSGPAIQMELIKGVDTVMLDISGSNCFGLRCEVDDNTIYNFIPIAATGSYKKADLNC
ncbi:hypothetical protein [Halopseudomonas sabulinigri]|nr:hypothetical protein [Halopseudomonas sabulinigri]